ncbi:Chitin synthase, class 1, partial [Ascosphaera atra]
YVLLTPTYINVLNIYAFCNTHDISWGTKGDDKPEKLGSANIKPDGKLDIELPQDDGDLNAQYDAEILKFQSKPPKEEYKPSEQDKQEDYYRGFRSAVLLVWITCNFALCAVVLNTAGFDRIEVKKDDNAFTQNSTIYMAVILWSVAGLSFFRFCGAMWYLFVRAFRGV